MDFNYEPQANDFLAKLVQKDQKLILSKINTKLENFNPKKPPPAIEKVRGAEGCWRLRAGNYRVIFSIDAQIKAINILKVEHRRVVYKNF